MSRVSRKAREWSVVAVEVQGGTAQILWSEFDNEEQAKQWFGLLLSGLPRGADLVAGLYRGGRPPMSEFERRLTTPPGLPQFAGDERCVAVLVGPEALS